MNKRSKNKRNLDTLDNNNIAHNTYNTTTIKLYTSNTPKLLISKEPKTVVYKRTLYT